MPALFFGFFALGGVLSTDFFIDTFSPLHKSCICFPSNVSYSNKASATFFSCLEYFFNIFSASEYTESAILLLSLSTIDAVLSEEEKEAGVALIDIGGGTTDVAIFKDGIIKHTAVIPFGGNVITRDIKTGLSILEKQAELLKIKFGSAMYTENQENVMISIPGLRGRDPKEIAVKNLSEIIGARYKEIIDLVYHQIKASGYENKLMTGIVLTGGGSKIRNLKQLASFITGKETRIGYPNEHLGSKSKDKVVSPMYATSVGLVLKGFEHLEYTNTISKSELIDYEKGSESDTGRIMDKIKEWFTEDNID